MSVVSIVLADTRIRLEKKKVLYNWIELIIHSEKKTPGKILIYLCSDDFLLEINKKYLNHFFYTDIITFNYNDKGKIFGELYISIDRVNENAERYKKHFTNELYRIIAHGVLHLCGYNDKTSGERKIMRSKEEAKLKMLDI